jgi:hypothetical protein
MIQMSLNLLTSSAIRLDYTKMLEDLKNLDRSVHVRCRAMAEAKDRWHHMRKLDRSKGPNAHRKRQYVLRTQLWDGTDTI